MPRRGITRRGLLQSAGIGGLGLALGGCASDDFEPDTTFASDAPNTLLIITDSTRADYIGAYNSDSIAKTPNLDALAKESLTFDLAVPESMPTGPVRRCVMSGMRGFPYRDWAVTPGYPAEAGWRPIGPEQPIFTQVMGDAGINTAYVTDNPFIIGPAFAGFRPTTRRGRTGTSTSPSRGAPRAPRSRPTCCLRCRTPSSSDGSRPTWAGTTFTAMASASTPPRAYAAPGCACSTR